jgi:hypothetical protein
VLAQFSSSTTAIMALEMSIHLFDHHQLHELIQLVATTTTTTMADGLGSLGCSMLVPG